MTRDDGTGLWRPLLGGGMSVVKLSQLPAATVRLVEDDADRLSNFRIEGRKVASNDVSLN
jgi:hypothetical protein